MSTRTKRGKVFAHDDKHNTSNHSNNTKHSIKLVMLGDSGVGKTSLLIRYMHGSFHPFVASTIGASFCTATVTCRNNNCNENSCGAKSSSSSDTNAIVELKIWDTAGQERYQSLTPLYFRGAAAALLVYDVTKIHSLERLRGWVRELLQYNSNNSNDNDNNNNMILIVVGQKCDLAQARNGSLHDDSHHHQTNYRSVSEQSAREFAESINAMYIETSARDNINVKEVFEMVANAALSKRNSPTSTGVSGAATSNAADGRIDWSAVSPQHLSNKCC